jgi:hypothetical protein
MNLRKGTPGLIDSIDKTGLYGEVPDQTLGGTFRGLPRQVV